MDALGFINSDGSPSEDGYKYIAWMEAQFVEADQNNDVRLINSISGDIQHYYVNVYKLKTMSPETWLRDYKNSIARGGYRNYIYAQEQVEKQSQLEATTEKTLALEAGMGALQEALATQKATYEQEMENLRAELAKLMAGGKKRASKAVVADDEDSETDEV